VPKSGKKAAAPEDLLVGEAVEGAGETAEGGRVGEEGVREGRADQVGRVGRDVAALVVGVERVVQPDQLDEALRVAEPDLVGKVERQVLGLVDRRDGRVVAVAVDVVVDAGGEGERLGDAVERVLERRDPVLGLFHAGLVLGGKLGVMVQGGDTDDKLGHRVEGLGKRVEDLFGVRGQLGAADEFLLELLGLLGGRDLAGQEVPEHGFGEDLLAALGGREVALALGDRAAPEADALLGVEDRRVPEHVLDAAAATDHLLDGDIAEGLGAVLRLDLLEERLALGDDLRERLADSLRARGVCISFPGLFIVDWVVMSVVASDLGRYGSRARCWAIAAACRREGAGWAPVVARCPRFWEAVKSSLSRMDSPDRMRAIAGVPRAEESTWARRVA
jgi:hypothetical protein